MENKIIKVLKRNAVKCLVCNTILESKNRHHYVQCSCSNKTACDGGLAYQRVLAMDLDLVENLSEYTTYDKLEYDSLQQEHKEKQRILNERGVAEGKLVKLFGEYYDIKVIDLLLSKGIIDNDLYNTAALKEKVK